MAEVQVSDERRDARRKRAIRVPKMAEVIAAELRQQIIEGTLKEGERLPAEKQLVEHFGVSRITFREAFCILESEGLISISRGVRNGAIVHRPTVAMAAKYMDFLLQTHKVSIDDVYSSLAIFEPAVVRMLAEKATAEVVEALRRQLKSTYAVIDDHHQYGVHSAQFHELLVTLSGLKSLELFMGMIGGILATYVEASARPSVQVVAESRERKQQIMAMKEELVDAIAAHDAAAAEDVWKRYFSRMREFILRIQPMPLVGDLERMQRR
jgi:DNA-binding FadR family transcriptional regulator